MTTLAALSSLLPAQRQPLRPLDTHAADPMIAWHDRMVLWHAARAEWRLADQHAKMSARLEHIDRLCKQPVPSTA